MRIQTVCLFGLMVGLGACGSDDTSSGSGGTGGTGGAMGGTAGNTNGGSGGFANGGSGGFANGGSGGTVNGGTGGTVTGGTGGTTGGSGGTVTGGTGGTTGGSGGTVGGTGGTTGGSGGTVGGTGGTTGGSGGTVGGTGGTTGGSGGTTGGSGGTTGGTGGTTGGTGGTTGGTGGTTGGTGGTGGTTPTCTPLTVTSIRPIAGNAVVAEITPELGTSDPDYLQFEFYSASTGAIDLATVGDYATCTHCVLGVQDVTQGATPTYYFQVSGTMNMSSVSLFSDGAMSGTAGNLSGVTLTEVTINPSTYVSTPVSGGRCLTLQSANWSYSCNDGGTEYGAAGTTTCDDCTSTELSNCCLFPGNACGDNPDCVDLISCVNGCADDTCINNCATTYSNGVADYNGLATCLFGDTDTGGSDSGACGTVCQ